MGNFCFMDIVVQLYNFQKNKFYTKLQTNRALMRLQKQALQRNDLISFYRRGNFEDEEKADQQYAKERIGEIDASPSEDGPKQLLEKIGRIRWGRFVGRVKYLKLINYKTI